MTSENDTNRNESADQPEADASASVQEPSPTEAPSQSATDGAQPMAGDVSGRSAWTTSHLVGIAIVVLVTLVAFWPTLHNGFVYWDDDVNLLRNEAFRGFGVSNLRWMFSTTHQGPYQPLSWLSLALDYKIYGLDRPWGFHLTSMLLHAAAGAVFFLVALRLLGLVFKVDEPYQSPGLVVAALLAGLAFAVHPLRVESVAWATERRDVLSGLFFMLAVLTYLRARAPHPSEMIEGGRSMGWPFILFIAALLSKGTTVVLPVILLILDAYPLRRLGGHPKTWFSSPVAREVWYEKIPFIIAAALAGYMAIQGQIDSGAMATLAERDIPSRIAVAFYAPAFYLYKTFVPINLSPLYEWPVDFSPFGWAYVLSGLLVIALTVLFSSLRNVWPAGLAIWIGFLVFLLPALVPFQAGVHLAADRYTYLACLAWALLFGGVVGYVWLRINPGAGMALSVVGAGASVLLVVLTMRQAQVWENTWTLWARTLEVNPNCWHAWGGLGADVKRTAQRIKKQPDPSSDTIATTLAKVNEVLPEHEPAGKDVTALYKAALALLHRGAEINPQSTEIMNSIGLIYFDMGRHADALPYFRKAVETNEDLPQPHYNLAGSLMRVGRLGEAMDHLKQATEAAPGFAPAFHRLGEVLALRAQEAVRAGRREDARGYYRQALNALAAALERDPTNTASQEWYRRIQNRLQTMP